MKILDFLSLSHDLFGEIQSGLVSHLYTNFASRLVFMTNIDTNLSMF